MLDVNGAAFRGVAESCPGPEKSIAEVQVVTAIALVVKPFDSKKKLPWNGNVAGIKILPMPGAVQLSAKVAQAAAKQLLESARATAKKVLRVNRQFSPAATD